ncbi:sterol desaturase family protein [Hymenobacter caeli]|uniref:Sterol desaturase/sphingolipid hydroxylase (Fatty acid hydroxylase superfamily) n=1 Tax=Hymenobacter caeli TaxID=2735894 RepID=A0ABX2FSY4_9BACT|nr:sterol desaturase family protein [Hymenobacter caeli]NRT19547.1 sterol desaturase/sphingolipid hydroxylase (fatty acid hydroxylase superfamily) [Hymenobacter caeli]
MPLFSASPPLLQRFDRWAGPALALVGLGLLLLETRHPLRRRTRPRPERWRRNALLAAPALPAARLTLLPAMVGLAQRAAPHGLGRQLARLPGPLRLGLEVLALDYLAYSWHRLLHAPLLWRLHRVHHSDLDMDLTTAWRFHFGEMLASIPYRAALPALLGIRPATVLAYEAVFEAGAAFHHSNWRLPLAVERRLAPLLVTPRAHGIHHSVVHRESQSNFGVVLTLWDRLHRTLRLNVPQQALTIGVPAYPDPTRQTVAQLLALPLAPLEPWARPDGTVPGRPAPAGPLTELSR